jgi:RND family efflux transporter MFP subunit
MEALLRFIRRVASPGGLGGTTDKQLLERFTQQRDENAFAALVQRHGPMVLGVCGRLLRDPNDAEDAFQATFLVLVRKAASLSRPHLLANWLHGVARRTALEAKVRSARRHARERGLMDVVTPDSTAAALWADLRPVLDEEVSHLPARYRMPFVLCYLEGRTNEEAARIIGCPKGTVLSRLAWARERLRVRLTRRGLAPSAAVLAAALSSSAARATVPPALARGTVEAALAFAGVTSSAGAGAVEVISLANGVLRTMFWTKTLSVTALVTALGLAGAAGVAAWSPAANNPDGPQERFARQEAPRAPLAGEKKQPNKADIPQVDVVQVKEREASEPETFTGRIEPLTSIQLRARVSGYLVKANVKDGAEVKNGDVLFEIDPRPYVAELDKATAILLQAEARLKSAAADLRRLQALRDQKAASSEELDRASGKRDEAEAAVQVARASRAIAQLNVSFTRIAAPISGILGRRLVDTGSLIKADETVLVSLASRDPMVASFDIDERTALRLRRVLAAAQAKDGTKDKFIVSVAMGVVDEKDFPRIGKMEPTDFRVDPTTGTVRLRALFANTDNLLIPGMFCRVRLTIHQPAKALVVPPSGGGQ